jgi:hypothetical protein
MSNVVVMRLLPPDSTGTRRVRVCWLMQDANGPVQNPGGEIATKAGPITIDGARGRIVCQPKRTSVAPHFDGVETHLCINSDDPRAATCPECKATPEYKSAMAVYDDVA